MKTPLLPAVFFLLLSCSHLQAQNPIANHYVFNRMIVNPACAGFDYNYITVTGLANYYYSNDLEPFYAKAQNIRERYLYPTVDGAIKLKTDSNHLAYIGYGAGYIEEYSSYLSLKEYKAMLSFGYMVNKKRHGILSFGVSSGIIRGKFSGWFEPPEVEINPDPLNRPFDLGVGIQYSETNYYAGFSIGHFNRPDLLYQQKGYYGSNDYDTAIHEIPPKYSFMFGCNYALNAKNTWHIQCAALVDYYAWSYNWPNAAVNISSGVIFKDRYWAGLGFGYNYLTNGSLLLGAKCIKWSKGDISFSASYPLVTPFYQLFWRPELEIMLQGRYRIY
jgi:type IX secretion system PorP/SprF family membrane protein